MVGFWSINFWSINFWTPALFFNIFVTSDTERFPRTTELESLDAFTDADSDAESGALGASLFTAVVASVFPLASAVIPSA